MTKIKNHILTGLKGFAMGAGSVTPCVSAGTIALLTGIYSNLIGSLDAMSNKSTWKALLGGRFKEFWKLLGGEFLLTIGIGFTISILLLAKFVTWGLTHFPVQTWSFFFGLIVASTVLLLKGVKGKRPLDILFIAVGIAAGIGLFYISPAQSPDSLAYIFLCGAVSVITMVLPGIAGSFVLQIMGKYEVIMRALDFQHPNWPVLWAFFFGCAAGILAFSKFLKWLMSKWEKPTIMILTGFIIGSLVRIWPYSHMEAISQAQLLRSGIESPVNLQIPYAILFAAIGAALVGVLEIMSGKMKS